MNVPFPSVSYGQRPEVPTSRKAVNGNHSRHKEDEDEVYGEEVNANRMTAVTQRKSGVTDLVGEPCTEEESQLQAKLRLDPTPRQSLVHVRGEAREMKALENECKEAVAELRISATPGNRLKRPRSESPTSSLCEGYELDDLSDSMLKRRRKLKMVGGSTVPED